ncbi:hypothetical protein K438DRAFT_1832109 [Mycena galopus ATCC 62051]|nr:hypothetical protein K438DRAFT_1832109 [Mycena galopus ATCC 62051]
MRLNLISLSTPLAVLLLLAVQTAAQSQCGLLKICDESACCVPRLGGLLGVCMAKLIEGRNCGGVFPDCCAEGLTCQDGVCSDLSED